ncbi:hypothetical protein G6O67_004313 [Ophiocordyceps sinensis]|uniref:Uncharacterized protein n=1 Tax=Ophiocordyceps sinensis TaxID=72228 RepID=A0A8H4M0W8_9HYPO|nr:hypothetical protein G6O67_004313 [Ophiocordyceps sinensis]
MPLALLINSLLQRADGKESPCRHFSRRHSALLLSSSVSVKAAGVGGTEGGGWASDSADACSKSRQGNSSPDLPCPQTARRSPLPIQQTADPNPCSTAIYNGIASAAAKCRRQPKPRTDMEIAGVAPRL